MPWITPLLQSPSDQITPAMPELAEVSRIVYLIRYHLVGKTLSKVQVQPDDIIYGKAGTSAVEFQKAMQGKKVVGAGQQGKYFWVTMASPPHAVLHFGMAGWLKVKDADTYYYRSEGKADDQEWPPKYWKFLLEMDDEEKTQAAFVDFRRLSRIRLVDCPAEEIRQHSPLKENGPDPVADKNIVTEEWLASKLHAKRVPVKAFLLDQANISGIGNWMGLVLDIMTTIIAYTLIVSSDEILYHAKIHPEQHSNTLSGDQIKQLDSSIHYVCDTSVGLLADSEKFPENWIFKHRWGKGKKNHPSRLPNGDKISYIKVGGRTSAVVDSVQKKSGPNTENGTDTKTAPKRKRAAAPEKDAEEGEEAEEGGKPEKKTSSKRKSKKEDEQTAKTASSGSRRSTRTR